MSNIGSKADHDELAVYWHRETNYLNEKVDDAFKDAQDHAYALGLARGREQLCEFSRRLNAAQAADDQREWSALIQAICQITADRATGAKP